MRGWPSCVVCDSYIHRWIHQDFSSWFSLFSKIHACIVDTQSHCAFPRDPICSIFLLHFLKDAQSCTVWYQTHSPEICGDFAPVHVKEAHKSIHWLDSWLTPSIHQLQERMDVILYNPSLEDCSTYGAKACMIITVVFLRAATYFLELSPGNIFAKSGPTWSVEENGILCSTICPA